MFAKSEKAVWSTKDPRSIRSREALRKAFRELLETRAPDRLTIRDVTTRAGIGYTTFFRHYTDKDDILHELIAEEVRSVMESSRAGFSIRDTALGCLGICRYVDANRDLWVNLLTGGGAGTFKSVLIQLSQLVSRRQPIPQGFIPADLAVNLSVGNVLDVITWWLRQPDPAPPEQVAKYLNHMIEPLTRPSPTDL